MTNLYYIMGKSASGKDTIYKKIKEKINIESYILYTTRPIRDGEQNGKDYFFVTSEDIKKLEKEGKIIESRTYQTVYGPWIYATVLDNQLKKEADILTIGTLESYKKIKEYFSNSEDIKIYPIYIFINEEERRKRAIEREEKQAKPKYEEMERRLKADNIDFSKENLEINKITKYETFENYDLEECVNNILKYMNFTGAHCAP